jgi:hypothetical protein
MGGGSGGTYTPLDIDAITKAANARIQAAFNAKNMIVFVCHRTDFDNLSRRIKQSDAISKKPHEIITSKDEDLEGAIKRASLVVFYVEGSQDHDFVDEGIRLCVQNRREPLFVRAERLGSIPPYVIQYRIKTVLWDAFLEIVA